MDRTGGANPEGDQASVTVTIPGALSKFLSPSAMRSRHVDRKWIWGASKALKTKVIKSFEKQAPDAATLFAGASSVKVQYVVARGARRRVMDADNLISTLKYVQDGIAKSIGVDDKNFSPDIPIQVKAEDPKKPYIKVTIIREG